MNETEESLRQTITQLESENDELNEFIQTHIFLEPNLGDTFTELAIIIFEDQLKILKNVSENKQLFSNEQAWEKMLEKQIYTVFDIACVLEAFDTIQVPTQYQPVYNDLVEPLFHKK